MNRDNIRGAARVRRGTPSGVSGPLMIGALVTILLSCIGSTASGQVTSSIFQRPARSQRAAANLDSARRADSIAMAQRAEAMHQWVDSMTATMGLADHPPWERSAVADSSRSSDVTNAAIRDEPAPARAAARESSARFTDGALAPKTASALPFIMLVGVVLLSVGSALLCTARLARLNRMPQKCVES